MCFGGYLGLSLIENFETFSDKSKFYKGLAMSRECFFEKMGTDYSSLEILQGPEVRKDQLKLRDLKYLGTF